jgi:hypothetical protein
MQDRQAQRASRLPPAAKQAKAGCTFGERSGPAMQVNLLFIAILFGVLKRRKTGLGLIIDTLVNNKSH